MACVLVGFELFVPRHFFRTRFGHVVSQGCDSLSLSSLKFPLQSFTYASEEYTLSSSHASYPHLMPSSLPALVGRKSTFSPSRAARSSSSVRRFAWRLNLVSACTFRRICPALAGRSNLRLWIGEFRSPGQVVFETFRVCRIIIHPCGDPGSALLRVRLSDHLQPNDAPNSDTIFFVLWMRLPFSSFPVSVTDRRCGSWDQLPRDHLASSKDFRLFPTAYHGSSALLCFASECCGTTPLLHCCSRCVRRASC